MVYRFYWWVSITDTWLFFLFEMLVLVSQSCQQPTTAYKHLAGVGGWNASCTLGSPIWHLYKDMFDAMRRKQHRNLDLIPGNCWLSISSSFTSKQLNVPQDHQALNPNSWKYWRSLNMAAWPQTDRKRTLAQFKFGSGVSGLFIEEHCHLLLEALKQSHEFTNLQEMKLAACLRWASYMYSCVEGRQTGPRALLHALLHYALCTK